MRATVRIIETVEHRAVTLLKNEPPQIADIQVLDARGFSLGAAGEITEGREIVVNVLASDRETGVDSVRLFEALGADVPLDGFASAGQDAAAPFQFHIQVPVGAVGEPLRFTAEATDLDGNVSTSSPERSLMITADAPPTVAFVVPNTSLSAIIEGQDLELMVDARDDLGEEGIDRVVFYVNGVPFFTAFDSEAALGNSATQTTFYRALIHPPSGATGFEVYAVAFDILGQEGRSETISIGSVEDTVVPDVDVLWPPEGEILTASEAIELRVGVSDVGVLEARQVAMRLIREAQDEEGEWIPKAEVTVPELELQADGSDPDNSFFLYTASLANNPVLSRGPEDNQRVRVVTTVTTPNHVVSEETTHEVGLAISARLYTSPGDPNPTPPVDATAVFYTAADQHRAPGQTGELVAAWSTLNPLRQEEGLGNPLEEQRAYTGIFLAESQLEAFSDGDGRTFLWAPEAISDVFTGVISELDASSGIVVASKAGVAELPDADLPVFAHLALQEPNADFYQNNLEGELLLFTIPVGEEELGTRYLLRGRVDMPFPNAHGIARIDNVVFVANGNGGVQVVDISNLAAPYRVGFIKPNGYARDVAIGDGYAFIAASFEGLVVADIDDPSMPIIASVDTFGVANRVFVEGRYAYVTDMAGDGRVSQLNIVDMADPFLPTVVKTVPLEPARPDFVEDGAYDVTVVGGKAFVSVHYSDQEDQPSQSIVEIIDLEALEDPSRDPTIPAVIHRTVDIDDFGGRGILSARGGIYVAGGQQGLVRLELPALSVLSTEPARGEDQVSTLVDAITIELSGVLPAGADLRSFVTVNVADSTIGLDVTDALFEVRFADRQGEDARRFIELRRLEGAELERNERYVVTLREGLAPLTGLPLSSDFEFDFFTSPAGAEEAPRIVSVEPGVGGIEGGPFVVCVENLGENPELFVGGQRVIIDRIVLAADNGTQPPCDQVFASTLPNNAGAGSIRVVTSSGLSDTAFGGYVYTDQLQVTAVDPAIVRVAQSGQNDIVSVIGFGFGRGTKLRAWRQDSPEDFVEVSADEPELRLETSQRMAWTVPDFGGSYRGFVDIEVRDGLGRVYRLPNALFYGRLELDRAIAPEVGEVLSSGWVPDATRLPPGLIRDIAVDSELQVVYVVGSPADPVGELGATGGVGRDPRSVETEQELEEYPRGWISLVGYDPAALDEAAPLHGLGYYNTPPDLLPRAIALGDEHVYVAAAGLSFPFFELPYEDRQWLLVYDREMSIPGDTGPVPPIDRQFKYALPLPFDAADRTARVAEMVVRDDLLFIAHGSGGFALATLADPARPSLIRTIDQVSFGGSAQAFHALSVDLDRANIHVSEGGAGSAPHWVFDAARPSTPVLDRYAFDSGERTMLPGAAELLVSRGLLGLGLFRASPPLAGVELRRYEARGFDLGEGDSESIDSLRGLTAVAGGLTSTIALFDPRGVSGIELVDAIRMPSVTGRFTDAEFTAQGVLVASTHNRLLFVDSLLVDVKTSDPLPGEVGVPTNQPLLLGITRPADDVLRAELEPYIALVEVDGSEDGLAVPIDLLAVAANPYELEIRPTAPLSANTQYEIRLRAEPASRRTVGLFEHVIPFTTASDGSPAPEIVSLDPAVVDVSGSQTDLVVRDASVTPLILVAGQAASIDASESLGNGETRFTIGVPPNTSGPASVEVINSSGAHTERLGALRYLPALRVESVSPERGPLNGGNWVALEGSGFPAGEGELTVSFGNTLIPDEDVRLLQSEEVEVRAPPGILGTVDITLRTLDGQRVTVEDAYTYEQPVQSQVFAPGTRIHDVVIDPTGVYAVAAAGEAGVMIFNIDPSSIPADISEEELRAFLDQDGDGRDDRVLAFVPVPGAVYSVDTFFERGVDRVIASGTGADGEAAIYIVNFEPGFFDQTSIIGQVPLPGGFSLSVDAENGSALVSLADGGVGLVDIFLPTEPYLNEQFTLPNGHEALDAVRIGRLAGEAELYAIAAGNWDLETHALVNALNPDSGGFYLVTHDPVNSFQLIGSVPVPSSAIAIDGTLAYLAAGEAGVVIVDISDPSNPQIVRRVDDIGPVYDVAVNGRVLYVALGESGVASIDVTDPDSPMVAFAMESFGNDVRVIVGGNHTAVGAGSKVQGGHLPDIAVLQVTPDVLLKIFRVDPLNRIVDRDALDRETIIVRFNKAIDLWPPNLGGFEVVDQAGAPVPHTLSITNNDALIELAPGHGLDIGEALKVTAQAGIASVKPISGDEFITLFELKQDQSYDFTYRGARPDIVEIDAFIPRRFPAGVGGSATLSALGVPLDPARVRVFVGQAEVSVVGLESNAQNERAAVILLDIPPIVEAGQYDVTLLVEKLGVWEQDILQGALTIDAPIEFASVSPSWGPHTGGSLIEIRGRGFEPGNTVTDGMSVRIGDVPVASIRVLSTTRMQVVTAGGLVGRNGVFGQDRYGNATALLNEQGFGYGIRRISNHALPVGPTEVYVDQQSGVAIANGGRFIYGNYADLDPSKRVVADVIQAVSIDVQDPDNLLLVGGASTLQESGASIDALLQDGKIQGQDAVGLAIETFVEDDAPRKRAYIANGVTGGFSSLNLDEQNGLQLIAREESSGFTGDVAVQGRVAALARVESPGCSTDGACATCVASSVPGDAQLVSLASPADPVSVGPAQSPTGDPLLGSLRVRFDAGLLWAGGETLLRGWNRDFGCPAHPGLSLDEPASFQGPSTVRAFDLFGGRQLLEYNFDWNVRDVLTYGDYLVAALGEGGVEIVDRDRADIRTRVAMDAKLQIQPGPVTKLKRFGNLLFASAKGGGVLAIDLSEPLQPYVVSAGNVEQIEDVDYRQGRLVAVSSEGTISAFELPGSFVVATSVDEGGLDCERRGLRDHPQRVRHARISDRRRRGQSDPGRHPRRCSCLRHRDEHRGRRVQSLRRRLRARTGGCLRSAARARRESPKPGALATVCRPRTRRLCRGHAPDYPRDRGWGVPPGRRRHGADSRRRVPQQPRRPGIRQQSGHPAHLG